MFNRKKMKVALKITALSAAMISLFACDLKTKSGGGTAGKALAKVAKAADSCEGYKTENQADGENTVVRTLVNYKFNLYWDGSSSKLSLWKNKLINDNYSLDFNPLTVHVLNDAGAETDKIVCKDSKASAANCISRLEAIVSMVKEARQSLVDRRAKLSSGKGMTFKCSSDFASKKIAELRQYQRTAP